MKKSYQNLDVNSTNNMKEVIRRKLNLPLLRLSLIFVFLCSISLHAQDGDVKKGKAIFIANCASCHKLDNDMTGPKLRNVEARLEEAGKDRAWIYAWVKNSGAVIKSGDDAYANKIFKEWNNSVMTAMPQLSNEDIDNVLAYTAQEKEVPPLPPPGFGNATSGGSTTSNNIILSGLALLFALLAIGLFLVKRTLNRFAVEKDIEVAVKDKTIPIWKAFVQNQFLLLVTAIFFLLASGYFVFGYLMQIDVNQGYQPVQEIHFSHKIHAGDNKIDCKYCHSSARVSKMSGIPSANICMNCHKTISEFTGETNEEYSKTFYDAEIQKLYNAVGWDGKAYTGKTKPIKWTRIHNLPDFAYFNHSQHVTVAGIECQECHGPVEEMEIVYQHAPLTMGWCINCHRETNVNIKDNAYYKKIHDELKKKYKVEEFTAAQMGGLECGKCHY